MKGRGVWVAIVAVALPLVARGAYLPAKAWLAQCLLERAWRRARDAGVPARPWPWADTWPVARLEAPSQGLERIVLAGGSGRTMAFGPGHLDGTALPGADGNCVVVGHRDTHFSFLASLRPEDRLLVERPDGRRMVYRVVDTAVVDRSATWVMAPTDERVLTLVTCYPFTNPLPGGRLRYVVWAVGEGSPGHGRGSTTSPDPDPGSPPPRSGCAVEPARGEAEPRDLELVRDGPGERRAGARRRHRCPSGPGKLHMTAGPARVDLRADRSLPTCPLP